MLIFQAKKPNIDSQVKIYLNLILGIKPSSLNKFHCKMEFCEVLICHCNR